MINIISDLTIYNNKLLLKLNYLFNFTHLKNKQIPEEKNEKNSIFNSNCYSINPNNRL